LEVDVHEEDLTTQAKILDTTVKLIFTTPPGELTTRMIAGAAKVNIAAINYHFRSKEELVNRAMEAATATAFEKGIGVLLAPGRDPVERLRDFLTGYVFGLVKFPGLTKTAFLGLFREDDSKTFYGRYMKEMLEKVGQVIAEIRGPDAVPDNATTTLRVLSCVIFPFLLSNTLREVGTVDYSDDEARRRYIDTTLAILVGTRKEENRNG
jgi:TetR/AcrR family transcriptional regulator, regulator of cefoperazone and chloramphenicol sensitivity